MFKYYKAFIRCKKGYLLAVVCFFCLPSVWAQGLLVKGKVTSEVGELLPGASVREMGTGNTVYSDKNGFFSLAIPDENATLVVTSIGFLPQEVTVTGKNEVTINVILKPDMRELEEVVVVGYGEQTRASVTGSVATVNSDDLTNIPAPTVSQALIGKVAGITTRVTDGRPGAAANMQIRNLGNPLYVIDGVQSGAEQFNQLGVDDIENISILKDASAAIYGLRAANGVVLVTTKKGALNQENKVNVNTYYGWQSLTRFPKGASAADFVRANAEADINEHGATVWTPEEVAKWQKGTEEGYQGFDWSTYQRKNAPQSYINFSTNGGGQKTNYYLSLSRLSQDAVYEGYNFSRMNLQSNIETRIGNRLKLGLRMNGKVENEDTPGLPGADDYWQALFGQLRNLPTERPYANDNPLYPATNNNFATNYATFEYSGYSDKQRRTLQTTFDLEYKFPITGLAITAMYTYFYNNFLHDIFEKTYSTYTYDKINNMYDVSGGQQNPFRTRKNAYVTDNIYRSQLNYKREFGRHNVSGVLGMEAQERTFKDFLVRSRPATNYIDLIDQFNELQDVIDIIEENARAGIIFRGNYAYDGRYLLEVGGRYDGSWRFPPGHRWGLFPSLSLGWRISGESFWKNSGLSDLITHFKLRASYGEMGDEGVGVGPFAYVPGYNWGVGTAILDGALVTGTVSRGMPVTTLSWINSAITNIGFDFSLWRGKFSGSVDAFKRRRTGLPSSRYDVLIPTEVALTLPPENLNADESKGVESELRFRSTIGRVNYTIGGNATLARTRNLYSYKPRFGNSWQYYRNSAEDRWQGIAWGYEYIGQFQSEEEIKSYPVDIDGQHNTTLLPGDLIYRDFNNDGVINDLDMRPMGYSDTSQPCLSYGFHGRVSYKGIDFAFSLAGASLQSRGRAAEIKLPFHNDANSPSYLFNDRWHRADIFDVNSSWVSGKYPALRKTPVPSNNLPSTFWYTNISYLRLRNAQLGYTLPKEITEKLRFSRIRLYINATNLFSIDNVRSLQVDPETQRGNGLDYPTHRIINVGANVNF